MSDINFNSMFGDINIDYTCPKCKSEIPITLNDAGKTITCPKCNVEIELQKDESFDKSVDDANDSLKEFEDTLNNFGK